MSYTDQNAQFFAFDVLTVISGIAAAFLVGGGVHPDALAARADDRGLVRRLARHRPAVPGGGPALHGRRRTSTPRRSAYIGNNIAMTRLAFDVGDWERPCRSTATRRPHARPGRPANARHVRERPAVGLPRPLQTTPRPAPDRAQVLRLHRRRHRPLPDRRDPAPGHALGPRARARAEPAGDRLGQPADRLHPRHRRRRWCRSTRSRSEGQPHLFIGNLPPASTAGAPDDHPAAHLLRRAAQRRTS